MFYLLENNKIIDSENYKEPYILSKDIIRNREVLFLTSFKDQVSVQGPIKKQSENVFDLIESGDLVKRKGSIVEIGEINFDKVFCCPFIQRNFKLNNDITAIYKPNSKGDYIKVWEKKEKVVE